MGIIQTVSNWFSPAKASYGPADDFWYRPIGLSGEVFNITPEQSLKITAVYACIRILANTIASLPLDVFEKVDGGKELAEGHPLYELLKYQPNANQDTYQFLERLMVDCNTRGAFYAEKIYDRRGNIAELRPLMPDWMCIEKLPYGFLRFRYNDNFTGEVRTFRQDELFRVQLFTGPDGFRPISPIKYNADAIGIMESMERFSGAFFRNGAMPGGTLEAPEGITIKDETRKSIAESWNRQHQGPNKAFKIAVLDQGLKFNPLNLTNEDSQLIESRRFQLADIGRIFGVPLHMIQENERSTFNNIENLSLDFGMYTIRPWCKRIQHAIRRDLLFEGEKNRYFAEFNLNDLLSADVKSRAEFYVSGIQNGFMTRNEVRARENLNALEGLDEPLQPLNMVTQAEKDQTLNQPDNPAPQDPTQDGGDMQTDA